MNPNETAALRAETIDAIKNPDVRGFMTKGRIFIGSSHAASRLARHGRALLPVIEDVLLADGPRLIAEADPELGVLILSEVIHVYAHLSHQHGWSAKSLLLSTTGPLREELLNAFFQGYGPTRGAKRWRPVPPWLCEAVISICDHNTSSTAEVLRRELCHTGV